VKESVFEQITSHAAHPLSHRTRGNILSFVTDFPAVPAIHRVYKLTLWRRNFFLNFSTPVYKM